MSREGYSPPRPEQVPDLPKQRRGLKKPEVQPDGPPFLWLDNNTGGFVACRVDKIEWIAVIEDKIKFGVPGQILSCPLTAKDDIKRTLQLWAPILVINVCW